MSWVALHAMLCRKYLLTPRQALLSWATFTMLKVPVDSQAGVIVMGSFTCYLDHVVAGIIVMGIALHVI